MSDGSTPQAESIPPPTQPWFEIRRSGIHGLGAYATCFIPKGTRVIEYLGDRISNEEADARYDEEKMAEHHTVLFIVDENTCIDAGRNHNEARYINHSCDPNCESEVEDGRVFIDAIKDIQPGEELFFDYSYERDEESEDDARYICRCGAPACRGTILEPKKEKSEEEEEETTDATKRSSETS